MPRRVIKETHRSLQSSLLIRNLEQSRSLYWYLLGSGQTGRQGGGEGPACCPSSNTLGGELLANVYPFPQLTYNTALPSVNKQSYAASASDSLAFSWPAALTIVLN